MVWSYIRWCPSVASHNKCEWQQVNGWREWCKAWQWKRKGKYRGTDGEERWFFLWIYHPPRHPCKIWHTHTCYHAWTYTCMVHQTQPLDTHMCTHTSSRKPSLALLSSLFTLCRGSDALLLFTSICHSSGITLPASIPLPPPLSFMHTHTESHTLYSSSVCCIIPSSFSTSWKAHTVHK